MNNPNKIIMVRPAHFGFNAETSNSNKFQNKYESVYSHELAVQEFDQMVALLKAENLNVCVIQDTPFPIKPDAIFPNNWVSFHPEGRAIFYPMEAKNRRFERRKDLFDFVESYDVNQILNLTSFEDVNQFLEGTGSIIFDNTAKKAYCAESSRSNIHLFEHLCSIIQFRPISFFACDMNGFPIYHTNVMLSIGDHIAVVCLESIENQLERALVLSSLQATNRVIIEVDLKQMNQFAANCLEVNDTAGRAKLIMSNTAYNAFTDEQIQSMQAKVDIIMVNIPTIERIGGGSARCMLLGVFEHY
jgi:hypothetical protein